MLPGTTQAFQDAAIYARTNGYLHKWYVDIGAHVHTGQLLADIDTPEVDRQLEQARRVARPRKPIPVSRRPRLIGTEI